MATKLVFWIVSLAFLTVGLRNFEEGLSIDAPLYASIAKHIVQSGDWWRLDGGVPDFKPFAEHPHLHFWLMALIFKAVGAADWSARILGHLYYVGFLFVFYGLLKRWRDEKAAVIGIFILMLWYRFANFFSNVYLDPGLLFWGMYSLYWISLPLKSKTSLLLSGVCLSFAFLTKGLIALGFLPACLFLLFTEQNRKQLPVWFVGLLVPLISYAILLKWSTCPEFLSLYFSRQFENRMKVKWSVFRILSFSNAKEFLLDLTKDTLYFLPLAFFGRSKIAWLGLIPFCCLYLGIGLWGGQYWITVLPWLAWLIADFLSRKMKFSTSKVMEWSTVGFVAAVFLLQYIPIRSHGVVPPEETETLRKMKKESKVSLLIVDATPEINHFGFGATYAWYSGIDVDYPQNVVPLASQGQLFLKLYSEFNSEKELQKAGWSLVHKFSRSSLWKSQE
jgi:4-amino-4-deoxy-L-arabinose transferase-like glycosyltransferase